MLQAREELRRRSQIKGVATGLLKGFAAPTMKTDGRRPKPYPAFRRLIDRSGLAAFFSAGFFPSIGNSISFWPAAALRGASGTVGQTACVPVSQRSRARSHRVSRVLNTQMGQLGQLRHPGLGHCHGIRPSVISWFSWDDILGRAGHLRPPDVIEATGTVNREHPIMVYCPIQEIGIR